MVTLFQQIGRFLNHMDAKAWISMIVTMVLITFIGVMMIFGTEWLGINQQALNALMARVAESPFAILGVIAVFSALALTGFPQTLLFAGTAAAFGPMTGAFFSWVATLCSSLLTYTIGHVFGAGVVGKISAGRAQSMIKVAQRHGLVAAMFIRWIPSAPFIVVNAIFGAAAVPLWKFLMGTAIGVVPKIVVVSFITDSIDDILLFFQSRDPRDLLSIGGVLVAWLLFLLLIRRLYIRLRKSTLKEME